MRMGPKTSLIGYFQVLAVCFGLAGPVGAQAPPSNRVFHNSSSEVEIALKQNYIELGGRLPVLDGFVKMEDESLEHYTGGYYQYSVKSTTVGSDVTSVHVTAKITAWYSGSSPAQSGYRLLASNGRLESDLLDRLEKALPSKTAGSVPKRPTASDSTARRTLSAAPLDTSTPTIRASTANPLPANQSVILDRAPVVAIPPPVGPTPLADGTVGALTEQDLESVRQRREEAEKRIGELTTDLQNLEEIRRNQGHPSDLAIVRQWGTPVRSKPQGNAPVLFMAEAEDEYQILNEEGAWTHVQISGISRGWIRRAQLVLPQELADSPNKLGVSALVDHEPFQVAREETNPFTGDWEPLRGKSVRVIWTQPASTRLRLSSANSKREFAKWLFAKAYREVISGDQTWFGIVLVFDSADGGQIAATLASLKEWQAGHLPESAFWQQCSVEPPDLLQDPVKR